MHAWLLYDIIAIMHVCLSIQLRFVYELCLC